MSDDSNPIKKIQDLVYKVLEDFKVLIATGQWFNLFILLAVLLFFLFAPEQGILYQSISNLITDSKQYTAFFWILFFLLFAIYIIIYIVKLLDEVDNRIKWTLRGLLVLLVFLTTIISSSQIKSFPDSPQENFSYGEKSLFIKGTPEQEIYKRNKEVIDANKEYFKIAVSVPISVNNGVSQSNEFLRGVLVAQEEWNKEPENFQVVIGIADDGYKNIDSASINDETKNEKKAVEDIANSLVEQKNVLAIVGHSGSDVAQTTALIYQDAKLVAISPTSTAKREKNNSCNGDKNKDSICLNEYIFRTAINDYVASKLLVLAIIEKNRSLPPDRQINKVVIVYDSDSTYSKSFKSAFKENIKDILRTGNVVTDDIGLCNLADGYQENKCFEFIVKNKADAVLFIPGEVETALKLDDLITKIYELKGNSILFLGSDTMYQPNFVVRQGKKRQDTEGMLIPLTWHRKENLNICSENSSELKCKAAKIFDNKNERGELVPLAINWRTATSYDATKAILEGLKIAKESPNYCGGFWNDKRFRLRDCMRKELKKVLVSNEFNTNNIKGATANIKFSDDSNDKIYGERELTKNLGVVVEARNGNFYRFLDNF